MQEEPLTVPAPPTETAAPSTKSSRRKRGNRLLIVSIVIVSLASLAVLGLLVNSVLTVQNQPLQSLEERDAVIAEAEAEANPRNLSAQMEAASANILAEDYEKALLYAERAVMIDPSSLAAKLVKAHALRASGDLKQARTLLEEIREAEGESSSMYANASLVLAVIDEAEGKFEDAIENLKVAQTADPTNADLLVQLAGLQERVGQLEDAAATYGEALRYVPDLEPAIAALRAMKSGPADYQLALVAWRAGDQDEARRLMEQAATESPDVAWVQVALGEFLAMIGDKEAAREAYQAALAIDPANEEAKAGLDSL